MIRILTVCLGNICRSPAAEAAIRAAAAEVDLDVLVDSAGTGAWHVGNPPDARMRAAGWVVGLEIEGTARRFTIDDFDRFDLIVTMDSSNHRDVLALAPSSEAAGKVRMFRSFHPSADEPEVPDPYYGGPEGFDAVIEIVRSTARHLVTEITG